MKNCVYILLNSEKAMINFAVLFSGTNLWNNISCVSVKPRKLSNSSWISMSAAWSETWNSLDLENCLCCWVGHGAYGQTMKIHHSVELLGCDIKLLAIIEIINALAVEYFTQKSRAFLLWGKQNSNIAKSGLTMPTAACRDAAFLIHCQAIECDQVNSSEGKTMISQRYYVMFH